LKSLKDFLEKYPIGLTNLVYPELLEHDVNVNNNLK